MSSDHADYCESDFMDPEVREPDFRGFTIETCDSTQTESEASWQESPGILKYFGLTRDMIIFAREVLSLADESTVESKNVEEGAQDGEKI